MSGCNLEKSLDGGCMAGGGGKPKRAATAALGGSCQLRHVVLGSAGEERVDGGCVAAMRRDVQRRGTV